jgi:3-oxoisoapionate decarboxylase
MGVWRPNDTLQFLEHCHTLGAPGIQAGIHGDIAGEATTRADIAKIRARAEQLEMYIEAMVVMPDGGDTAAFEQSLRDAQAAGAVTLRAACLGSRRYEAFSSSAAWQAHVDKSYQSIAAALPLLEKYKLPLGLENHKDWTLEEMLALFKSYSSEYFGVCLDFGNNLSLLDDPVETIEQLAPFTVTTHLKNMRAQPAPGGFLLSEVLLGEGYLDLPRLVGLVRAARPQARFVLEMITRDPLHVPCLSDQYWATFPHRNGLHLARALRLVDSHQAAAPLPRIAHLSHSEQLKVEDQNVAACLRYAHEKLDL